MYSYAQKSGTRFRKMTIVAALLMIASVGALSISDDAEILMRSEQAKFFPEDADPPEETLELIMNGQRARARGQREQQDTLMASLRCLHRLTGGRRLQDLLDMLICLQHGLCDDLAVTTEQLRQCVRADCFDQCMEEPNPASCLRKTCLTQSLNPLPAPPPPPPPMSSSSSASSLSSKRSGQLPPDVRFAAVEKRYRLGLYDCISSYCGELHGERRKSCIINYCHRSSTL